MDDDGIRLTTESDLFRTVQESRVLSDSKTFVDSTPLRDTEDIVADFRQLDNHNGDTLSKFIEKNFRIPSDREPERERQENQMTEYIERMWDVLSRPAHQNVNGNNTLLPLPHQYIVPGGRFREMYYWDTYFTLEGLAAAGRIELVKSVVKNFNYLIKQYGFIPTANREYYLSRSQPPMFVMMLEIIEKYRGFKSIEGFIPQLKTEYEYWMEQSDPARRCLEIDGTLMNRYYDDIPAPRPESYIEDVETTAGMTEDEARETYIDLKAAAESGWDFSTRWLEDNDELASIHTTDILPVDLNAILYHIETKLADWTGEDKYREAAEARRQRFDELFWDGENEFYFDHNWKQGELTDSWSLAATAPLFFGLAGDEQAEKVAEHLEKRFLAEGGLMTTLTHSEEQWDRPNGWAPLHWFAVNGLLNYGHEELAQDIAERWIHTNSQTFKKTGYMMEKYNVEKPAMHAEDGEYRVQHGFGWTNGVVTAFLENHLGFENSGKLDTERLREQF